MPGKIKATASGMNGRGPPGRVVQEFATVQVYGNARKSHLSLSLLFVSNENDIRAFDNFCTANRNEIHGRAYTHNVEFLFAL